MALSQLESDTISRGMQAARTIMTVLEPVLHSLNIIYDSSGGAKTTITQQNLDLVASFSGLTKGQLDDGMFALTGTLLPAIESAYTQLAQISSRTNVTLLP